MKGIANSGSNRSTEYPKRKPDLLVLLGQRLQAGAAERVCAVQQVRLSVLVVVRSQAHGALQRRAAFGLSRHRADQGSDNV
jgi:hypothetical protein